MNGIKYLPDTNIIIGLLKGRESAVKALEVNDGVIYGPPRIARKNSHVT